MGEDKRVLQLGGIGGLLAGVSVVLGFVILFAFAPPLPWTAEETLVNLAEFRTPFVLSFNLFLFSGLGFAALYLALYRSLRKTSPASALFGSFLGAIALAVYAVFFAGILTSGIVLSDLYAAAAPGDRAMVVAATEATNGVLGGISAVGNLFFGIVFISLGVAMLGAPDLGKGFGGVSVVLGLAAVVGGVLSPVGVVLSPITVSGALFVGPLAGIIFALLLGGKVYSLSRAA